MFDTEWVDDTAAASPASLAVLDACASAVTAEHVARHRTLVAVAALARTDAVVETGHRSLSRLLVELLHVDLGEARRLIRHTALLAAPESTPFGPGEPVLPATAQVASEGGLGEGHVEVVHRTVERLQAVTPPLPEGVVVEVERQLADLARSRSPQQLAAAAHEVLLRYDPDGEAPHDTDRPVEELRTHTGRDGSFSGRFRFAEPETAELIRSAIESRTPAPDPEADTTPLRPGRSLDARRGEALRLLAHDAGVADPTPTSPTSPKTSPSTSRTPSPTASLLARTSPTRTSHPTRLARRGTGRRARPRSSSPSTSTPSPATATRPHRAGGRGPATPDRGCSTASTPSAPKQPAASPATPASSPPSWAVGVNRSTSAARPAPSPPPNAAP